MVATARCTIGHKSVPIFCLCNTFKEGSIPKLNYHKFHTTRKREGERDLPLPWSEKMGIKGERSKLLQKFVDLFDYISVGVQTQDNNISLPKNVVFQYKMDGDLVQLRFSCGGLCIADGNV